MKRQYKKGSAEIGIIMALVAGLIFLFVLVSGVLSKNDDIDSAWDSLKLQNCEAPDGEGTLIAQKISFGSDYCPCDIDDEESDAYVGKYYSVLASVSDPASGAANNLFSADFLKEYSKDKPLKISEKNIDAMVKYIKAKTQTPPNADAYLQLDYELNIYYNKKFITDPKPRPPILAFCPSLKGKSGTLCQKEIFMNDWFVDGVAQQPTCKTSTKDCTAKLKEVCNSKEK